MIDLTLASISMAADDKILKAPKIFLKAKFCEFLLKSSLIAPPDL